MVPTSTVRPAPDWKFEPLIVKACAALDPVIWLGLSDVIEGAGGAFTWKFTLLETCPSGFFTDTAKGRVVSPTMMSTWICVAVTDISCELVSVVEPICSVSPDWKPVPVMVKTCPLLEPVMGLGRSEERRVGKECRSRW